MIPNLRYTLIGDGPSDRALLPILRWVILRTGTRLALAEQWVHPSHLRSRRPGLAARVQIALSLAPCDLLFLHRDAEKQDPQDRYEEARTALEEIDASPPVVCIVPKRMTEAWLLFSEAAIRRAASNPNGRHPLSLPPMKTVEDLPDPKETLNHLLRDACQLKGRRLETFRKEEGTHRVRVAEMIEDFSPLLAVPSFQRFYDDTRDLLGQQGWVI